MSNGNPTTTAEWLAKEEGMRLEPYHDVAGYPTIGCGHKLSDDRWADLDRWAPITRAQALELLEEDLERFRRGVADSLGRRRRRRLSANQETALVSLTYNIGLGAWEGSRLLDLINSGAEQWEITLEWLDWCKARTGPGGQLRVVDGLLKRRRREVELYYGS